MGIELYEYVVEDMVNDDCVLSTRIVRTKRDEHDNFHCLIEMEELHAGDMQRGWWHTGTGLDDIDWEFEGADGWPEEMK